jgi:hypothetical protein
MRLSSLFRQWLSILLVIGCVLVTTAWAGGKPNTGVFNRQQAGYEGPVPVPSEKVTIANKTLESVITQAGDTYAMTDGTIIVGTDGQQVSIRQMPVPCDVEISYSTKKGVRQAERVKILRVSSDATRRWSSKKPY